MTDRANRATGAAEQRRVYARVLEWGMWIALLLVVVTFLIHATQLLPSHVPVEKLPELWSMRSSEYVEATGAPVGWGWAATLGHGDCLVMIGIALLAGLAMVSYIHVIPHLLRDRDYSFVAIATAEILVIALAASGVLAGIGH